MDSFIKDVTHSGAQVTQIRKLGQLEEFKRNTESVRPSNLWDPMLPPATENSNNDEFNDSSLSPNWTEFDPNNRLTVAENAYGLQTTKVTTGASHELAGLYKSLPAGNFTITSRVSHLSYQGAGTYGYCGIALWENAANVAAKMLIYMWMRDTTNDNLFSYECTNYTTLSVAKLAPVAPVWRGDSMYLRIFRSGTNYYLDYSLFGNGWMSPNAYAAITLSFTPLHMGIITDAYNTAANHLSIFHIFRYLPSMNADFTGVLEGNRL